MTTTTAELRRGDLAQFLRSRRARISPADVGLPEGRRRRTPGLRREEVAQLAGVGVTWYTWLEQGRSINASVQVLDAIARTLRLDRAEREHLYRLAGLPSVPDAVHEPLAPELQDVLDALVPLPAVVYNGRYDVLAWNRTYQMMFPGVVAAAEPERNVLWQMFVVPPCCSVIGNREAELAYTVANFRAAFGSHLGEPPWASFVDNLGAASPEFAATWARHDVAAPASRVKVYRLGRYGCDLQLVASSFAVAAAPDLRMVVNTPLTEADRAHLVRITAGPPVDARCDVHRPARGIDDLSRSSGPYTPIAR
jgi:transcriptional regulator with XRE-family HTH domain